VIRHRPRTTYLTEEESDARVSIRGLFIRMVLRSSRSSGRFLLPRTATATRSVDTGAYLGISAFTCCKHYDNLPIVKLQQVEVTQLIDFLAR
jgi:hypothetical protein